MIGFAVLVDAAAPFLAGGLLGFIIDIPAGIIFVMWFSHYGVSVMHPSRVGWFLGTAGIELTPLSALPVWTFTITKLVLREWRSSEEI